MKKIVKEPTPGNFSEQDQRDINALMMMKKGNVKAYAEILKNYKPHLMRLIFGYTRSKAEAEDMMQEIVTRIFEKLMPRPDPANPGQFLPDYYTPQFTLNAFMTRVAENYLKDVYRKKSRSRELYDTVSLDELAHRSQREDADLISSVELEMFNHENELADESVNEVEYEDRITQLSDLMKTMDSKDRLIMELFYINGMKTKDIAFLAGDSDDKSNHIMVRTRLNRARNKMRTYIAKHNLNLEFA